MTPHTVFANDVNCFTREYVGPAVLTANIIKHDKIGRPHTLRLSPANVFDMRNMDAMGVKRKAIARKYNVSYWTVDDAIRGRGAYKGIV